MVYGTDDMLWPQLTSDRYRFKFVNLKVYNIHLSVVCKVMSQALYNDIIDMSCTQY